MAVPSESQEARGAPFLAAYLTEQLRPALEQMGFVCEVLVNPAPGGPLLLAERIEDPDLPTVLIYGHGDVVRGLASALAGRACRPGSCPSATAASTAAASPTTKASTRSTSPRSRIVIAERGRLGFNAKVLIETSEEVGSPGLREICEGHQAQLAADLLLASDGPRLAPDAPTIFLGSRGALNFDLVVDLRDSGHHSGNWGGLLGQSGDHPGPRDRDHRLQDRRDPARRAQAAGDPAGGPPGARRAAAGPRGGRAGDRSRLGRARPVAGREGVRLEQLRGAGLDRRQPATARSTRCRPGPRPTARSATRSTPIRRRSCRRSARRCDAAGLAQVEVRPADVAIFRATRTDPEHSWVTFARRSIERTIGRPPVVLPNLGGSLPNDCFAEVLGMPTVWVPHSYRGCQQHAPNEHALPAILREGLLIMTGLFWDLGESGRARDD